MTTNVANETRRIVSVSKNSIVWFVPYLEQLKEEYKDDEDLAAHKLLSEQIDDADGVLYEVLAPFYDKYRKSERHIDGAICWCGKLEAMHAYTPNYNKAMFLIKKHNAESRPWVEQHLDKATEIIQKWIETQVYDDSSYAWMDICCAIGIAHYIYKHEDRFSAKMRAKAATYFQLADYLKKALVNYFDTIMVFENEYGYTVLPEEIKWSFRNCDTI